MQKWNNPYAKDFLRAPQSWTKIDKQVDRMFSDVAKATQFKALLREDGARGVANMIDKFNFYGKGSDGRNDGDVSTMRMYGLSAPNPGRNKSYRILLGLDQP